MYFWADAPWRRNKGSVMAVNRRRRCLAGRLRQLSCLSWALEPWWDVILAVSDLNDAELAEFERVLHQ